MRYVAWFSCGAASAVAAKLAVQDLNAEVVYCDTLATEHPDNQRFFDEVQGWIGKPITIIRSTEYVTINDVFERTRYMAGLHGARCTTELKKLPREAFQQPDDIHIFGYTADEQKRIERFEKNNPSLQVEWILADRGITKNDCYGILRFAGIKLPAMYALGFDHNNCIACVKASSPAYWSKVRKHFPAVFDLRARQSRAIGARLVRVNGKRIFLDELPFRNYRGNDGEIECGPVCQSTESGAEGVR